MPSSNAHQSLFETAQRYLPGGVSASARLNPAISRPFFVSQGEGAYVYDLDGRQYIDLCMSHGASLLGHHHPKISAAVRQAIELGLICSYETEHHTALARRVTELVPCADLVRFAGSGTETIMHALRLARAVTGRQMIIKFEGHFHGYSDDLFFSSAPPLEQAGPAATPIPYPQSAGIPASASERIVIVPFNDPAALEAAFAQHGAQAAALILEPINYDSGCIRPQPGFVQLCRALCDRYGVLLFFDEVLTAFRMSAGGAQTYLGVVPDLCVLGKAFGGGLPISAIAGRRHVMAGLRPVGPSEHSGTYLAHLTTVLGALAALEEYSQPGFYERLNDLGDRFYAGFQAAIAESGVPVTLQHVGPRFGLYFGLAGREVTNYRQAALQNTAMLQCFIAACIEQGVYFHTSPHHGFSAAHTEADLDQVLSVVAGALQVVAQTFPGQLTAVNG
jgi:glutamate-1-semialdehyde 2,1-aminomutase